MFKYLKSLKNKRAMLRKKTLIFGFLLLILINIKLKAEEIYYQNVDLNPEDIGIVVSVVLDNSEVISEIERIRTKINISLDMNIAEKTAIRERIRILKTKGYRNLKKYINRGKKYIPLIKEIFEEYGIPDELIFLPIVESHFNIRVKSPAGAAGLWQFMPLTARTYGLKINKWIDERYDVEKSTIAAAKHLRNLYTVFGDWTLALASYNSGEGAIIKRINLYGGKNFWDIRNYLSKETRNYVPNFLATVAVIKEILEEEHFDFNSQTFDILKVNKPVSLKLISEISGIPYEKLRRMNLHLKKGKTPPLPGTYNIYLPAGYKETIKSALERIPLVNYYALKEYVVKKNDTLEKIAYKFGITKEELKSINKLKSNKIRAGMIIKVPTVVEAYPEYAKGTIDLSEDIVYTSRGIIYRVKSGDSLISIAKKFRVSVKSIKRWNKLYKNKYIYPGQKIVIYKKVRIRRPKVVPMNVKYLKKLLRRKVYRRYVYHIVREGESLIKIAKKYGISVKQLKRMNNLKSNKIFVGQRLKVIKIIRRKG